MEQNRITSDRITSLKDNEIFVFGSNKEGMHGGGAARIAYEDFSAEWGVGIGMTGQCYAIPTMDRSIDIIRRYVDDNWCKKRLIFTPNVPSPSIDMAESDQTDLAATRTLVFWTHLRASKPSEPRKSPSYTKNTNLVPQKRFMWYRMAVTQGFVPRKRFIWDKAATYKEIREMLFLTSSNF